MKYRCLGHEAVSVVIPGAKTPAHVEENLAAFDVPPLMERERERVNRTLFGKINGD